MKSAYSSTALERGTTATFRERSAWVTGKRLLDEAKQRGERLPIIFCPAEETRNLHSLGLLEKIEITGNETAYTFSGLTRFTTTRSKTVLRKRSEKASR